MITQVPALTGKELDEAEKILYTIVQDDHYATEIRTLSRGKPVSKSS